MNKTAHQKFKQIKLRATTYLCDEDDTAIVNDINIIYSEKI